MIKEKALLTWTGKHPSYEGQAGAVKLFMYTWDGSKRHPGEPWVMRTDLPGHTGREWRSSDPDSLQSTAEDILSAWLKSIGVNWEPAS